NCGDSVVFCGSGVLNAKSNTVDAGPSFNYLWSNGTTTKYNAVTTSGYYWVKQTSPDGCFISTDSIYVTINPLPAIPTISDSKGININAISTKPIILCGDSVLLTGGNFGNNTYFWTGPTGKKSSATDWATVSGKYYFTVTNKFGCQSTNVVDVTIDSAFSVIGPKMICVEDTDKNDSVSICEGSNFSMYVYDSISNPLANGACIPQSNYIWSATPDTINYAIYTSHCANGFSPKHSGIYHISSKIIRTNNCGTDTITVNKSIYVDILPSPKITITGSSFLCPGDSTLLIASGGGNTYNWTPPLGNTNDSIWVSSPNTYKVSSTNSFGCVGYDSYTVNITPQPIITMNPSNGLICPTDSVQLFCNGTGIFQWFGPSGPIKGTTSTIYVKTPGFYYCIRTDINKCTLVSNTVQVNQYATPYLLASPSTVLCKGNSITISVVTNAGSIIQWQSPLTGNSNSQIVTAPGTYSCLVTSCGIQTIASVTITMSTVSAMPIVTGPLTFCEGDSVIISANSGMTKYLWQPGGYNQPVITFYKSGTYTLTTTDSYGCTASSIPVVVNVTSNNASIPTVKNTAICPNNFATLIASGPGTIMWYNVPNGGMPIDSGLIFITPFLHSTTTYYLLSHLSNCKSNRVPVTVTIKDCDKINIPNVFTPDGNNVNDIFFFDLIDVKCFHCKIYNRWGVLVYEWEDANAGWDGTIMSNKKPAVDGVYYYILNYCDYTDTKKELTGFIQLLRNK
ncbi:MAG: gliding motility-associated C-terminal domain-containing protein, partial [Bacteroidetes bacterium]|nr:gliding motility-associated C-terminal domain-containing protein [Bacteroidota bacterium]